MQILPEMIVDGVLAILLIAVIVVCTIVYRRLSTIREGQEQLRQLVDSLNNAVVDAQRSVGNIRQAALDADEKLSAEIKRAKSMAEELSMITEAGNNLADRIEQGLTGDKPSAPTKAAADPAEPKANKKQQQEILAALREAR
ncbi:DUF6468 domain-containing protein [Kordiimonas lacus]|uniref:DUF6468 domain-containing protein n=1 Tax=Kordiimonas lacus TaxID=637679 RepID=A0A1G6VZE2_9PROT|nr:DUF6468 domain-containing protein [Kordiimonas lacus]SDD59090.1 hypothetical protein SAMN04488071_0918 [Kordiimonas lacus]